LATVAFGPQLQLETQTPLKMHCLLRLLLCWPSGAAATATTGTAKSTETTAKN